MRVPLAAIATIGVTFKRRSGGVTLTSFDGRSAAFRTVPRSDIVTQLAELGFAVEHR